MSIDDPSFPATVYARPIENEEGTHDLIWSQQAQGGLTAAYHASPIAARNFPRSIDHLGRPSYDSHCVGHLTYWDSCETNAPGRRLKACHEQ